MPRRFSFNYEKGPLRKLFQMVSPVCQHHDYPNQVYELKAFTQDLADRLAEQAPRIRKAENHAKRMRTCRAAAPFVRFHNKKTQKTVKLVQTCQTPLCPQCHYRRARKLFVNLAGVEASGWALARCFVDLTPFAVRSLPNSWTQEEFNEGPRTLAKVVAETKALIQRVRSTAVRRAQRVYQVDKGVVVALVRPNPLQNLLPGQGPGDTWELSISILTPYVGQPPYEMELLEKSRRKVQRPATALKTNILERVDAYPNPHEALVKQIFRAYQYPLQAVHNNNPAMMRYWPWFMQIQRDCKPIRPFGAFVFEQDEDECQQDDTVSST